MIKTLRRKFVVTAMTAVTALLLVLLGGINGVNLWLKSRDTDMLLTALSEGEGTMRPEREGQGIVPAAAGRRRGDVGGVFRSAAG